MYIYKTTNITNGKIYIGLSKKDKEENPEYLGSGKLLVKEISKIGRKNFKKEILFECQDKELLLQKEIEFIEKYNPTDRSIGYNISTGGEWGDNWTNNPRKEEIRELFRNKYQGKNNPNYGNKWTKEQKEHMSQKNKGRLIGDKNPAKRPEIRKILRDRKIGGLNPMAKKWKVVDVNGNILFQGHGSLKKVLSENNFKYGRFSKINNFERLAKDGTRIIFD
jgi:group I intron endonuclease